MIELSRIELSTSTFEGKDGSIDVLRYLVEEGINFESFVVTPNHVPNGAGAMTLTIAFYCQACVIAVTKYLENEGIGYVYDPQKEVVTDDLTVTIHYIIVQLT